MRSKYVLLCLILCLTLSACQSDPVCPEGSVTYVASPAMLEPPEQTPGTSIPPTPGVVEMGGKELVVDRIVTGPLCDDTWSGIVYVGCSLQIVDWSNKKNPTFLEGCSLTIEPDTVVYVAAHNNSPYYNGCSCHMINGAETP